MCHFSRVRSKVQANWQTLTGMVSIRATTASWCCEQKQCAFCAHITMAPSAQTDHHRVLCIQFMEQRSAIRTSVCMTDLPGVSIMKTGRSHSLRPMQEAQACPAAGVATEHIKPGVCSSPTTNGRKHISFCLAPPGARRGLIA